MKTIMYWFTAIIFFATAGSCKKDSNVNKSTGAAPPLMYEIVNKDGKVILDSANLLKDSVTLSYDDNGTIRQFSDAILDLNAYQPGTVTPGYAAAFKNYNGIAVLDFTMLQLSTGVYSTYPVVRGTPVHTFDVSYHGKSLGTIYFEYLRWNYSQMSSWQQASVFTFDSMPVKIDSTAGRPLYVIQLQE
jgi:hypothetical protein